MDAYFSRVYTTFPHPTSVKQHLGRSFQYPNAYIHDACLHEILSVLKHQANTFSFSRVQFFFILTPRKQNVSMFMPRCAGCFQVRIHMCVCVHILYSSKPFTLWSKNTSTYCTRQPYLISIVCIFVIPVTFAWHLNPPPRRCHAGRTGLRLAVYIGFKSQDQNFPLKTPSS